MAEEAAAMTSAESFGAGPASSRRCRLLSCSIGSDGMSGGSSRLSLRTIARSMRDLRWLRTWYASWGKWHGGGEWNADIGKAEVVSLCGEDVAGLNRKWDCAAGTVREDV